MCYFSVLLLVFMIIIMIGGLFKNQQHMGLLHLADRTNVYILLTIFSINIWIIMIYFLIYLTIFIYLEVYYYNFDSLPFTFN